MQKEIVAVMTDKLNREAKAKHRTLKDITSFYRKEAKSKTLKETGDDMLEAVYRAFYYDFYLLDYPHPRTHIL